MRLFLTTCLGLLILSAEAQIAKSYNFNGNKTPFTGIYVAKHPSQNLYYTATIKQDNLLIQHETIVTQLDNLGNTLWYSSLPPMPTAGTYSAIGDVIATNDFVFVSSYVFPSGTGELKIYKLDHSGVLLDSVIIAGSGTGGLALCRSQMAIDSDGNLFTALKTGSNLIQYIKVNPSTMDVITQLTLGHTNFSNSFVDRGIFCSTVGTNSVITYNALDTVKSAVINSFGTIIDDSYFYSPDGEATDVEYTGGMFYILINKYFSVSAPADNPIRIITMDISGAVINNDTWPVQYAVSHSNLALNTGDGMYVCGRSQNGSNSGGMLFKIDGGILEYEYPLMYTNLREIEICGNQFVAVGDHLDKTSDCQISNTGSAIIIHKCSALPEFEVASPHMLVEVNNISTFVSYDARNFSSPTTVPYPGYAVAGTGGGSTVYNTTFTMAGEDINGQLKSCSGMYGNVFAAGPITDSTAYDYVERDKWERVWKISKAQIDAHILAFQTGDGSYITPEPILNWPGNGDPVKGQSQQMARFQDLNGNNYYEPFLGEYPLIKGDYCVLSIYNDVNDGFQEQCLDPIENIGVEIHEYIYGFECETDSSLQNTVFVYYEIINRSTQTLYNTLMGNLADIDINFSTNDYVSSDPLRGIFYIRDVSPANSPEQAYMILAGHQDNDGYDNAQGIGTGEHPNGFGYGDGINDNERQGMTHFLYYNIGGGANGDPFSQTDYYYYMQSVWQNGAQALYGGNGLNSGTTTLPSSFMFPGDSDYLWYSTNGIDPGFYWTEEQAGNAPGDRRGYGSTGPFLLVPFDTIEFDIAYVTGMENVTAGYSSHDALIANVDEVRNYFDANLTACGQDFGFYAPFNGVYPYLETEENELSHVTLFPNPSEGNFTIQGVPAQTTITIFSVNGEIISQTISTQSSVNFDCSHLSDGIYFVRLQNETSTSTLKFVKQ